MNKKQLIELLNELVKELHESEWIEFKLNFHSPEEIGEQISALANGACIQNKPFGYLVFGVEDQTQLIKGTAFKAKSHKKGNEDLEHWLVTRINPKIDFKERELVANALIHQDLTVKGFPMVEIFTDRIEISNSGIPLVTPDRFIDAYVSRNEKLADLMRRIGFCEEKGSGLDKVIFFNELYQLPAINVIVAENQTRVTMYGYKTLNSLDKKEKIRACYQHACLKYVSNEKMTNQSLRERFKIEDHNYSIASRIIKDALLDGAIKEDDPDSKSRKYASYLPFWA
ncbi:transcriptional regulator [Candidatus Scalindua japonica]|uniref:Transcriptional regulator n=1 Tax=Candidatus Scalindua japonica TaxID=1284222 RepID=A0A286U2Z9_9BACT|nr:ATP-binding protein [Candidatus Scalindua japonica]GAX62497.1 transcriptional regulator [Candidatus Scalindua japonica]